MVTVKCKKCKGETKFFRKGMFRMDIVCIGCMEEEHKCTCEVKVIPSDELSSSRITGQIPVSVHWDDGITSKGISLIAQLKHNRKNPFEIRRYLIRKIYKRIYPDYRRIRVKVDNWESEKPYKVVIDSKNLHCVDCGNKHAHYIVYNIPDLLNLGWRLCWKCLSPAARLVVEQFYWHSE